MITNISYEINSQIKKIKPYSILSCFSNHSNENFEKNDYFNFSKEDWQQILVQNNTTTRLHRCQMTNFEYYNYIVC